MATSIVRKVFSSSVVLKKQIGVLSAQFREAHWNKDWKPGPYPKTPEERAAAAKKYGMIVEDYEPYPDDGNGFGDYPKLPIVTADNRDMLYTWDDQVLRRDFGEPLHIEYDMYGEDRVSNVRTQVSGRQMRLTYLGVVGGLMLLFFIGQNYTHEPKILPKQYYNDGLPHYTFEPAD